MNQAVEVALTCLKFREWAALNKLKSLGLAVADHQYYSKSLEQRRSILNAPSINYLCKTIVLENKAYDQKFESQYYPRYICVIFQYVTKFHSQKLAKFTKLYQNNNCQLKAANKHFHWRLVEEQKSFELTGYDHNGVVPLLMKSAMPIVISDRIQELVPQFLWMGGGHPIVKLRISLAQFREACGNIVLVGNVTEDEKGEAVAE